MIDWMVATERALPCPLAAGISERRHQACRGRVASSGGLDRARTAKSEGFSASRSMGGGGMTTETRRSSDSGRPMKKSAPRGAATSLANQAPMVAPVMRRTTSPTRYPWVTA